MSEHFLYHGVRIPLLGKEKKGFHEDLDSRSEVLVGIYETGRTFTFRCPVCNRVEQNDQRMEPVCTGPGWADSHPYEVMVLVSNA